MSKVVPPAVLRGIPGFFSLACHLSPQILVSTWQATFFIRSYEMKDYTLSYLNVLYGPAMESLKRVYVESE